MLAWLGGKLLAAPVIGAILNPIVNGLVTAQKQKLDAAGNHEARVVELVAKERQLDQREAELNAQSYAIDAGGNWFQRVPRPAMGWIVVILLAKVLLWDKAFGQWTGGHTDGLDVELWWVVKTIIISYFGGRSAEKIADRISGVWKTK